VLASRTRNVKGVFAEFRGFFNPAEILKSRQAGLNPDSSFSDRSAKIHRKFGGFVSPFDGPE